MHLQTNKKILIYVFLFMIVATFNNRNLNNINLMKVEDIFIEGLDEKKNSQLIEKLNFFRKKNIFFLDKIKIKEIKSNNLVKNIQF